MKIRLGQLRKLLREAIEEGWEEVGSEPQRNRVDLIIERIINELDAQCKRWWQDASGQIANKIRTSWTSLDIPAECNNIIDDILSAEDVDPGLIFGGIPGVSRQDIVEAVASQYVRNLRVTGSGRDDHQYAVTSNDPTGLDTESQNRQVWSRFRRRLIQCCPDLDYGLKTQFIASLHQQKITAMRVIQLNQKI